MRWFVLAASAALIAGCQASPPAQTTVSFAASGGPTIIAPNSARVMPVAAGPVRQTPVGSTATSANTSVAVIGRTPPAVGRCGPAHQPVGGLAGRTVEVGSISDINLRKGEVVLTFDDGPRPATTPRVLAALSDAGVRATFFPVGQMARTYPKLLQEVARRGHTIGHHTDRHAWLSKMRFDDAMAEIAKGERAIARALSGSGAQAAPFFRFPYLAHTSALRKALAERGTVVVDVDIDSADYKRSSGAVVRQRTMGRLRRKGRGVVLFHDIHGRTASMLPGFLRDLKAGGFKVVHMVPRGGGGCAGRVG